MTSEAQACSQTLGEEESIWFKISPFINADEPIAILMRLSDQYGNCIPINMRSERIYILSDIEHIRRVLVDNVDNDVKYFDGLKPILGKAMITVDGALWQKIRQPQQPRFHPHVYTAYLSYLLVSIKKKMDEWSALAGHGETFELLEETWGLWPAPLKRIHEKT
ncbi:MAG: cytochrome P450 [Hyphomicrobiaceae bacterium]